MVTKDEALQKKTEATEIAKEEIGEDLVPYDARVEIDVAISTAHRYPRSVAKFQREALAMATMTNDIAASCFYCLQRKDKTGQTKNIEGPSVRLAEIMGSAWGNMRYGAKIVREEKDFVVAQGVAHDLENNVAMSIEVKRRIVDRNGNRYSPDMVAVTANAACAIALRNAIFRVIPKSFTEAIYLQAKKVAVGDASTLSQRRLVALEYFAKAGVPRERVLLVLGREGIEDVTLKDLELMTGWKTAIADGESSVDQIFSDDAIQQKDPIVKPGKKAKKGNENE